jgi:hypothetical protein
MKRLAMTGTGLLLAAVIAGAYATTTSRAQSPGTPDQRIAALEAQVATMNQQVTAGQIGGVIAAVTVLDTAGLHGMDESLAAGDLKAGFLGAARRARLVAVATAWPAELAPVAKELTEHLTDLQAALEKEDVKAAATAAHEAHDGGHDLSAAVNGWLAKMGGTTASLGGAAGDHGDDQGR